jgi:antitoxin MazE
MRSAVRRLGNSTGVIIPKSLLAEVGVAAGDVVEMTLDDGRIILKPVARQTRAGWAEASQAIAEAEDDALVWPEFGNSDDDTLVW